MIHRESDHDHAMHNFSVDAPSGMYAFRYLWAAKRPFAVSMITFPPDGGHHTMQLRIDDIDGYDSFASLSPSVTLDVHTRRREGGILTLTNAQAKGRKLI